MVQSVGGRLAAAHYESKASWYDPARATANFVVIFRGIPGFPGFSRAQKVEATFGRPARTYRAGRYTVLVWNRNLLRDLG
jgi:hypothetical protein